MAGSRGNRPGHPWGRLALGLILAGALLAGAGCARALREPPSLQAMAGTPETPDPAAARALSAAAAERFAARQPAAAREAAALWLRAALQESGRAEALVGAARALTWLVDHEPDPAARRQAAVSAVDAAIWCGRSAPGSPACDYWLGAALGLQARERPSTGLSALPEIAAAFKRAAAGDPLQESAGPERALALLYLRAPGWPTGPGDADLGLEHAEAAVARFPDYPPNLMALAEARAATGDRPGARQAWQEAEQMARRARQEGDPDAVEWLVDIAAGLGKLAGG